MRYKVSWELTDEFLALIHNVADKIGGEFEFDRKKDDGFSPVANHLISICDSYYPYGNAEFAASDDVNSSYVYVTVNGEQIKSVDLTVTEMPWYAVQSDDYTDWDDGSYDRQKAFDMARSYAKDGKTGIQIAVIDESTNFCVNGYVYDEESDRFILDNDGDRGFLDGFPVFC